MDIFILSTKKTANKIVVAENSMVTLILFTMNNKVIGIVILNYKTWEKTVACVESIQQTYPYEKHIVIVDNMSPNESFEKLSSIFSSEKYMCVTVIKTDHNGGFSYGNNYGFDYVCNNFPEISKVVITNNDIIFKEDALSKLISAFSYSSRVVMTAPSICNVDGKQTNAPWKKKPSIMQDLGLKSITDCTFNWSEIKDNLPVYMVSGCCFAVDRVNFISVGRLDDGVFLYNEENIFSKKFADAGLQIIYCPNANIVHDHGSTTGNNNMFVDKEYVKSSLYFFGKYEGVSQFNLCIIKLFYIIRITIKLVLKRYSNTFGYRNAIFEICNYHASKL